MFSIVLDKEYYIVKNIIIGVLSRQASGRHQFQRLGGLA